MENLETINGIPREGVQFDCNVMCVSKLAKKDQRYWRTVGLKDRVQVFRIDKPGVILQSYIEGKEAFIGFIDRADIRYLQPIHAVKYEIIQQEIVRKFHELMLSQI